MLIRIILPALVATVLEGGCGRTLASTASGEGGQGSPAERGDLFLVWVQDAKTGIPVEGASVRWFEQGIPDIDPYDEWTNLRMPAGRAIGDETAEGGLGVAVTDSTGAAFVPMDGVDYMRIEARKGDLAGQIWRTDESEGVSRIDLVQNFDLEVRVVDESGLPLPGVPVALRTREGGSEWDSIEASTSASGTIKLWNVGYDIATSRSLEDVFVAIDVCLVEQVEVAIDPASPPTDPITLVLPPTGEVEVVVRNGDGTFGAPRCGVVVAVRDKKVWVDGGPRLGALFDATPVDASGRALIRHVGLGGTLVALAQQNRASKVAGSAFWGPTRPGQRVRVVIDLGWQAVELRGRVVDAEGDPFADTKLLVEVFSCPPRNDSGKVWINASPDGLVCCGSGTAWTDEGGELRLNYDPERMWEGVPRLLLSRGHDESNPYSCVVDLQQHWSMGPHDLGDIVLGLAPILAAGRVVDDLDAPVSNASVDIFPCKNARQIRGLTDETGSFVLRGAEPLPELGVSAWKEGYSGGNRWGISPGATSLTIELPREAVIEGEIEPSTGRSDAEVGVTLSWKDGENSSSTSCGHVVGGRFRYDHLRPHSYKLTVWGVAEESIVQELEIHAGESKRFVFGSGPPFVTEKGH